MCLTFPNRACASSHSVLVSTCEVSACVNDPLSLRRGVALERRLRVALLASVYNLHI